MYHRGLIMAEYSTTLLTKESRGRQNEGHEGNDTGNKHLHDDLLANLFEPYRRGPGAGASRGSLGLGLFITRQIVLAHDGDIEVRSTLEEGTTFTVRLPRHPGPR